MIKSTEFATPLAPRLAGGEGLPKKKSLHEPPSRANGQSIMRLADFILTNRAAILAEWEEFAKTCSPASASMGIAALSDHASEMLTVIAEDLKTPQGGLEQSEKSKEIGRAHV